MRRDWRLSALRSQSSDIGAVNDLQTLSTSKLYGGGALQGEKNIPLKTLLELSEIRKLAN